jgi:uncharacterized protein
MANRKQASYGFMSEETLENVIRKTLAYAERECTIAYQGGEPTLRGLDFFQKSIELQNKYNINNVVIYNAIQTNGFDITAEWADFFVTNKFLVGLSLDGPPKLHDLYRKTASGAGSFEAVMKTIELFQKKKVEFNVLTVVNKDTTYAVKKIYQFFKKNYLDYLQFIPCLDPLEDEPALRNYSLTPTLYGQFLIQLFDLWYEDLLVGKQPYIRQFENYIAILIGRGPESCDMMGVCGKQYVIEADGAVYPCDFYALDEYKLGNLNICSIEDIDNTREDIQFIEKSKNHPQECLTCKYYKICRNGCRRTRDEATGKQYFCESYQMFFDYSYSKMCEIAQEISKIR